MSAPASTTPAVLRAETLDEAVAVLGELGDDGAVLGGGTWILRSPLRREPLKARYVALGGIPEVSGAALGDVTRLGAALTHSRLGGLEPGAGALGALAEAARRSAFPAVRNVATLAGNLAADPFPEADLVPALLAGEAELDLAGPGGRTRLDVASYLASRTGRPPGEIIVAVELPGGAARRSWFERITVRKAAEYSIASVAVSIDVNRDGRVADSRIAVGAVEEAPRRVEAAEALLRGAALTELPLEEACSALAAEVHPRDGLAAPGWYRQAVLAHLLERALARVVTG